MCIRVGLLDNLLNYLFWILQQNHRISAPLRQLHQPTVPTITCRTVISPIHPRWTFRTPRRFQLIHIWAAVTQSAHQLRRSQPTDHCFVIRGGQCRLLMSFTTPTPIRRSCKLKRSLRKGSSPVSVIIMVLMNKKDILFETRRMFCMCFKWVFVDEFVWKLLSTCCCYDWK